MRTYELMFVLDPRLSEDEAKSMTGEFKSQLESGGLEVIKTEHWGRRKLAYEIRKIKEGRYVLLYLSSEDGNHGLADVERRLEQHDGVLRYLSVRTDEDLLRAGLPLPTAEDDVEEEGEPDETVVAGDTVATTEPSDDSEDDDDDDSDDDDSDDDDSDDDDSDDEDEDDDEEDDDDDDEEED
jgi:ribosomal protein S6